MLTVTDITKKYGSHLVLDQVSFEVPDGKVTGFVGPNGAGKSTLMRIVAGLLPHESGMVSIDGVPQAPCQPRPHLGALLDPTWVHPRRTAHDHLRALALVQDLPAARVGEVLELTGLTSVAHRRIGDFSLGMRQRVGIATALLAKPRNILMDEPVNGLDPDGITWVRTLAKDVAASGCAVVISSHLLSELEQTADRIVVIGRGRILAAGDLADFTRGEERACVVRSNNDAALLVALQRQGVRASEVASGGLRAAAPPEVVGWCAHENGLWLTHLAADVTSLEERFREVTQDQQEFRGERVSA